MEIQFDVPQFEVAAPVRPVLSPGAANFLALSSEMLVDCDDFESVARAAVQLPVPAIADLCVLDLSLSPGPYRRLVTLHPDPSFDQEQRAFADEHLPSPASAQSPVMAAMRSGDTLVHTAFARSDAADRTPTLMSSIVIGLRAGDALIGTIAMLARRADRVLGPADRHTAEAYARGVGRAMHRARRFDDARDRRQRAEAQLEVLQHTADALSQCAADLRRELDAERLAHTSTLVDRASGTLSTLSDVGRTSRAGAGVLRATR